MTVQQIMTKEPEVCTPNTKLQEVAQMMSRCDCGAIPVVEDTNSNKPMGIITDRDIVMRVLAKGEDYRQMRAEKAMTPSAVSVSSDADVSEAERAMKQNQIRRVLVVDNDRCVGIVAQADIALERSEAAAGDVVEEVSEPMAMA